MNGRWLLLMAMLQPLALCANTLGPTRSYASYDGTAYDPDEARVLYRESHYLVLENERVRERLVLYRCADGTPFARKTVSNGFGSLWLPEFELDDARQGYQEGFRADGQTLTVYYRENAESELEREALSDAPVDLVGDAGFDGFVQDHWDQLVAGDTVRFHFLVPSRLDYMGFKVRQVEQTTVAGRPARVFRLALGGLLGLIVSGIDVAYDAESRILLRFEGLSNVRDEDGDNYVARIEFPLDQRRVELNSAALDAARETPLAASCARAG